MWVDLQIKHLCAVKIGYEVEKGLGKLLGDLATTYDQIYKRISLRTMGAENVDMDSWRYRIAQPG